MSLTRNALPTRRSTLLIAWSRWSPTSGTSNTSFSAYGSRAWASTTVCDPGRRPVRRPGPGRFWGAERHRSPHPTPPRDAAYWSLSRIVAVTSIELGRRVSYCIGRRGSCRLASCGPVTIHATTPCAPAADRDAVAVVPLSTGDCSDQAGEWCGLKTGSRRKIFSV